MNERESRELNSNLTLILAEFRQCNINITRLIELLLDGDYNEPEK